MGEYIDVSIQNSILPLSIILSSLVIGIYALLVHAENIDEIYSYHEKDLTYH